MGLTATEPETKGFDPAPPGVHHAICYALVDLGTHDNEFQGEVTQRHQVWISWEFPELMIQAEDDVKPRVISGFYTLSLHEKANLRKVLEGWRGREFSDHELRGFDLRNILEKPCLIHVMHSKEGRAKIQSIMPAEKKREFNQFNETIYFSFEDGGEIPANVPEGIRRLIMDSYEYNEEGQQSEGPPAQNISSDTPDEDIPF